MQRTCGGRQAGTVGGGCRQGQHQRANGSPTCIHRAQLAVLAQVGPWERGKTTGKQVEKRVG